MACPATSLPRRFGCAYRRNDGCVKLQFSVQLQLRCKLLRQFCRFNDFIYICMFCASLCRVGKHCYDRLFAGQRLEGICGRDGDVRQLLRIRVLLQSGIREDKCAVRTHIAVRNNHQEERGYELGSGFVFRICRHGRRVSAVEWHAPDTIPSASPILTIITP